MSYSPQPQAVGSTLVGTRDQIRTNFDIIRDDFAINHVGYDETGEGKHKFLQMPEQASAPASAANEGAFYAKDATGTNIFYRAESSGEEYQLTTVSDGNIATFATNTTYVADHDGGWTFLPGGLIMMYGLRDSLSSGNNTVTFPFAFPTAVFCVTTTMVRDSSNTDVLYAHTVTTTNFVMRNTSSSNSGYWTAIGN